jgi:hypothetical protein
MGWLCRAQDNSLSHDGGVARHYSLVSGWSTSYPETTGYIVPTMLEYARKTKDASCRERAIRMLDWLVSIQLDDGAFHGGTIDATPRVAVTFNTGQILLGLARGTREFGDKYREPMRRAADWLVKTQDSDGCWRRFLSPYAAPGEKVYDTHVAWGLLEAAAADQNPGYSEAALANVHWALKYQKDNGWFDKCCLEDTSRPLTHTIGYVFRGILEAYLFTRVSALLSACRKTADGLLQALNWHNGLLPGRLYPDWKGAVNWSCLTGSVQIAYCWLSMYQLTGKIRYRDAGFLANSFVRRTMMVSGPPETRGAVKGSFPVYGDYGKYEFLNWAAKFLVDSHMLEKEIRGT